MADGLLTQGLNYIDQQKQALAARLGLLMNNPQEFAAQLGSEARQRAGVGLLGEPKTAQEMASGAWINSPYGQQAMQAGSGFAGTTIGKQLNDAMALAQKRAALPINKGGLGLPKNNTAEQRAQAMGINTDAYHGSKQDITGPFAAGYDDNLAFVTQSPEFANKWIGKGRFNVRQGEEAANEIKNAEDLYKKIRYKYMDYEALDKIPKGPAYDKAYDEMSDAAKVALQKEFGLRGYPIGIHDVVYPLKVKANKTFNPETDMSVMNDFFKKNNTPQNLIDLYKSGNYMMYETKDVVNYLKSKGFDSMRLRESTGDNYPTIAVFDPETVRSRFAAFDPFRKDIATAKTMGVPAPDMLAAGIPFGLLAGTNVEMPKKEKRK
jgi:hypothetical protein